MSRGNTYSVPRDANRTPAILGVSSVDGTTVLPAEINPLTGGLLVEDLGGGGGSTTDTFSSISVTDAGQTVLNANTNRTGATVYNEGTDSVFLTLGTTASLTAYNVQMVASSYYEVPFGYTGKITAICNTGETATLRVGEFT